VEITLKNELPMSNARLFFLIPALCYISMQAAAQENPGAAPKPGTSAEELAKKLSNPVANLISVPFQNNNDYDIGPYRGSKNTINFQPVIPVVLTPDLNMIARVVLPIVSQYSITGEGAKQSGLSDATISAFFAPSHSKLIWAAGPAFLVPTATDKLLGTQKFAIGPTGLVLQQTGPWTYGILANQLWSVAGSSNRSAVNQMFLQPFLVYNWKSGAGVGVNSEITQNWQSSTCTVFLNPIANGVTRMGKQTVQFGVGPRIPIAGPENSKPVWGWRTVLTFVFPK
jgi:hypothetical protein